MTGRRRRATLAVAALAGVVVGMVATMVVTDVGSGGTDDDKPPPAVVPSSDHTDAPAAATITSATPSPRPDVLLVWTAGGLPPGLADDVATVSGVEGVTMVSGDEIRLTRSTDAGGELVDEVDPGWHLPLDALAVDPASFASFLDGDDAATVAGLRPGEGVLTETSAQLRRLGGGGTLQLEGGEVGVAGVVTDGSGAGAELLVAAEGAERFGVVTPRYLLVAHTGDRQALQRAVADRLDGRAVRFRSPAETAWLRHGDAVEPAARLKEAFGEFAVRDRPGRAVEIDPGWVARSIVTKPVPILGSVTCHRKVVPPLRAALAELEQADLAHLVQVPHYAGCYNARRTGPGQALSHHSWGAALDLNVDGNPRGTFSTQDPRLVQTLVDHGFTWGGTWLVPDPAHYEAPLDPG